MTHPITPKPSLPLRSVEQERWRVVPVPNWNGIAWIDFGNGRQAGSLNDQQAKAICDAHNAALDRLTQERDEAIELIQTSFGIGAGAWLFPDGRTYREHAQELLSRTGSNASGVAAKGKEGDATCPETTSLLRGSDAAPVVQSDSVAATPASGAPTETDERRERADEFANRVAIEWHKLLQSGEIYVTTAELRDALSRLSGELAAMSYTKANLETKP